MDVNTIAVIGAGTMGRGIAYAAAVAGYRTILQDISSQILERASKGIRASLDEGVARGKVTPEQKERALALVNATQSLEEAAARELLEEVPQEPRQDQTRSQETGCLCSRLHRRLG